MTAPREIAFDGIVGPTHSHAGLSPGNLAATRHAGEVGNPRKAAQQSLEKMQLVASLGAGQAVLPPHPRPDVDALRRIGFSGSDTQVLERAERAGMLAHVCSASAMWTANAATVAPSSDTTDARVHFVVANLQTLFHRSLEAPVTRRVLEHVFAANAFDVHAALPPAPLLSDEGAANHTRLCTSRGALHLFGWGRSAATPAPTQIHPARQSLEASQAVARLAALPAERTLFWQQHPDGIDAGSFHSDVLSVGTDSVLLLHELAFRDAEALLSELETRLGSELEVVLASREELAVDEAVRSYVFNSELLSLPNGSMALIAPDSARESTASWRWLERVLDADNPVSAVHTVAVDASLKNGGGPACLRLRVRLTREQEHALMGRVLLDDALANDLRAFFDRHYRDRLSAPDLADPELLREARQALDELTRLLELGSIYDFQRP